MNLRTIFPAALLAVLTTAGAHGQEFQRTLSAPQPDLYVSTGSGRIHVVPGSGDQVHIQAHLRPGWGAGGDVQERIQQILKNPPIRQSGKEIHVGDVAPEGRRLYNNITIDYEISAPRSTALNLRSGSGDIETDNLGRFLKAETGSGSIRAHGVGGPADLHSGSGDLELQLGASGEVRAETGSGSIRINGLAGALTARTGSGDIEANGSITGASHLQSGSGAIRVHLGQGSHLDVNASTGSGSLRVAGLSNSDRHHLSGPLNGGGPSLEAHTGSGDIEIN